MWPDTVVIVPGVTTYMTAHFGRNNVSYALLSTAMVGEWRKSRNANCPMICDRNRGTPTAAFSSWSAKVRIKGDVANGINLSQYT